VADILVGGFGIEGKPRFLLDCCCFLVFLHLSLDHCHLSKFVKVPPFLHVSILASVLLVHMRVPRFASCQCCDAVWTSIFDGFGFAAIVEEGRTEWQLFATICQTCFGSITNRRDGN
jgi:hypothetical protein